MIDTYAVIGNPIQHSKSPFIHAEFARQTRQAMHYEAILSPLDDFKNMVSAFQQKGGKGMNITLPFKLEAHALATRLTNRASAAQAVNTFKFDEDGTILGDNTDGAGLVRDIEINLQTPISMKRILLMGAGGAARGVILPLLQKHPALLAIGNRTPEKALALQRQFETHGNIQAGHYHDFIGEKFDILINATSASLHHELPPLPPSLINNTSLAYDMLYSNQLTPFLEFSKAHGAEHLVDGVGMLVEQAAESFLLWRNIRPKTQIVIQRLKDALHHVP